jgi:hypothetical protein
MSNPQDNLEPKLARPKKRKQPPVPVRTQASSFDEALFDEVQTAIGTVSGVDSGIPSDLDDELLGQNAKNDLEENWQKAQEMMLVVSSNGWPLIKESLGKMVEETKVARDKARSDKAIILAQREFKAMEKAVKRIIANVESAANTPNPYEETE